MHTQPTINGHTSIWIVGYISPSTGGFDWNADRDVAEAARKEWLDAGDCEVSEVRRVELDTLDLAHGDRDTDEITDALDERPELWEPEATA